MQGYAVLEPVRRAETHRPTMPVVESGAAAPVTTADVPAATVSIDLVGRSIGERVDERWARIREAWSQTVFFLFDAESWR